MANTSIILRVELDHGKVTFGDVAAAISKSGGDITSIDVIRPGKDSSVRDITVEVADTQEDRVVESLKRHDGIKLINVSDRTFLVHLGGKIKVQPTLPIKNRDDLSRVYTPGVAKVCTAIHEDQDKAYSLTIKRNTVAVITDGTAVLGLGDIGPHAAAPVMEGKAMLFKQLAGVDAFPICLDTTDTEEIIRTIKAISPIFGGINLEDISSPRCFEIETRLAQELDMPIFHDDQHGTAVVVIAGLLNALKVVNKRMENIRVVVNGIGAAGVSICKMLLSAGVTKLVPVDREGAIVRGGTYSHPMWQWLADQPQVEANEGSLKEVIKGADVFIGVSRGNLLNGEDIRSMGPDPIVFAMANPEPEVSPEEAIPHSRVYATGRSDYPNQINNVLVFPGLFRGALDCRARCINEPMKLAAARAIASVVSGGELNELYIIPSIFNEQVVIEIRKAVVQAAILTGVARRIPKDFR
ncbi:NAD-dependent malic enzyme [Paenibacillus cellulositrophicus]|uniref:NAD-dependent malic enzyme n=3 Tax=Paenibacillus TaxID=44249 RepID=A0A1R1F2B9_9BACL|nr:MULTISPECIES: NAD-dependent malic enzyme [Paenibacillus]MBJ9990462.1 NAD-dependent malic enzyme [Paenibacillus sp. S28]MCM2997628.1 NAD-dependent malic enzyme [Paenibacillus cellulositrophicus]OMF58253.1 NAD-dependent malic enzyme [Paenibacillus rhizosphaerae]RED41193.1 malate dehydrogenase (oxaloacetate-decarboxylating) [Paenibacillus sp. VMFN-D1]UYO03403.1 NAD-dependent malic enzyme [Paenibacillus sp. PSB04]